MWTSALLSNLHEGRIYWQQLQGTVIVQKRSLFLQCKSTPVVANCKHLTVHLSVFFLRSPYYLLSFLSRSGLQITLKQAITKHPFSDLLTSFRIEFSHCSSRGLSHTLVCCFQLYDYGSWTSMPASFSVRSFGAVFLLETWNESFTFEQFFASLFQTQTPLIFSPL